MPADKSFVKVMAYTSKDAVDWARRQVEFEWLNNYDGLWELIRTEYGGKLVDVLDLRKGN